MSDSDRREFTLEELARAARKQMPISRIVIADDDPDSLELLRLALGNPQIEPVLVISGLTRPDLQTKVDRLGNAKLLRKPFGIPELRAAVADLVAAQA